MAVQRQYTGTAGRIENAQVAVYLTYAARAGHALIDRALYLPQSWAGDQERRAAAGGPAGVEFATKPDLARQMIVGALDGGAAAPWVAGDEVYGADPGLRRELLFARPQSRAPVRAREVRARRPDQVGRVPGPSRSADDAWMPVHRDGISRLSFRGGFALSQRLPFQRTISACIWVQVTVVQ